MTSGASSDSPTPEVVRLRISGGENHKFVPTLAFAAIFVAVVFFVILLLKVPQGLSIFAGVSALTVAVALWVLRPSPSRDLSITRDGIEIVTLDAGARPLARRSLSRAEIGAPYSQVYIWTNDLPSRWFVEIPLPWTPEIKPSLRVWDLHSAAEAEALVTRINRSLGR